MKNRFYVRVSSSDGTMYVSDADGRFLESSVDDAYLFPSHEAASVIAKKLHDPGSEDTHGPEDGHYAFVCERKGP